MSSKRSREAALVSGWRSFAASQTCWTRLSSSRSATGVGSAGDLWIWAAVGGLLALSILMVLNTTYFPSAARFGTPFRLFFKHLFAVVLGCSAAFVISRAGSERYERMAYPLLAIVCIGLGAVLIPGIGLVRGGAQRWLGVGLFSLQPSEFAKLALVLYVTRSVVRKGVKVESFSYGVLPHALVGGMLVMLVALEPDFGTAVFLLAVLGLMLFAAGVRLRYLALPCLLLAPLVAAGIFWTPYRAERVKAYLDPWANAKGGAFQLIQSLLSFGSGGVFGAGLGGGRQKMWYLPEAHTDFIFSVVGEELGLLGALAVVVLFGILTVRGLRVAWRHPTQFGRLAALGITITLVMQALMNMGVVLGLLPTTGLALPLVSYGGSAMLASMLGVGILVGLSRECG